MTRVGSVRCASAQRALVRQGGSVGWASAQPASVRWARQWWVGALTGPAGYGSQASSMSTTDGPEVGGRTRRVSVA